jgi:MFS family permease
VDYEKGGDFKGADNLSSSTDTIDIDHDEVYTRAEQRKIIHRVDRRLVLMCGIMYCISLMDRTNLSSAAIAGMTVELKMNVGFRYSIVALVFFITYVIFQPPATICTRKIGPRRFLPTITLLWGALIIVFGFVDTWTQLAALRVVLGILEAGFFPGCVYLLSTWYSRYDVQKRYSVFYLIGCFASAASGILAYGFMQMHGLSGYSGWRWIFIMEGILSCIIALIGYVLIVDFPEHAHKCWKFLSKAECDFVIRRVNKDRSDATVEPFTMKAFLIPALDFKVWCFAMLFFCETTVTYSIAYFLPIILRTEMKFSIAASQCLVAPPYAFAGIVMFAGAWFGDKYHIRSPVIVFNALLGIIGLPIMGFAKGNAVRYFGIFLTTASANANVPAIMAYQANNIRGQWKRAFCSASLVGFGGIGGIAGSLVFRQQDAPSYRPGIWAGIACNILILIITGFLTLWFKHCNRRVAKRGKLIEGLEGFKYTL